MSVFTWDADRGAEEQNQPKIRKTQFGDGYEHRQAVGLNSQPVVWNLTFENREKSEADAIDAFLKARGAVESFDWTPPNESTARRFKCEQWSRRVNAGELFSITAQFVEVFEP